ncbi:NADH-quinone oxidoreductase subunit K [Anaeromyxobacter diazotrophicus]|uniref:Hydrogenase n=1 Tax=Anaeromyxobacter diazotrophicus TaxID=2590199 RepID=A0A7I9VKH0_9BACT|nr:NADH-quinone oxidoreductase subunit K [Anaeromyxobacter diazotrophicus]GEJ56893.1 hydrogenase [Anaeromyxobacter diazotrophicus]
MSAWTEMVFILVVVLDFFLLASSRLKAVIRAAAAQGALLAVLPLLLASHAAELGHVLALSVGALVVKGVVIPWLLLWAIREAAIRREVEPIVGFIPSLILGGLGVALAFAFSSAMPLPTPEKHDFIVPTALSTVWTGLLLVVSRRKAVSQVIGFLVLENGVFVFGLLLSDFMPTMVEAGVLLDLFAAVFVMGIVMFHINREFSSLDTEKLSALKD